MSGFWIGVLAVTVIGIICAVILSIASKFMAVKVDERFPLVRDCLPGANCGACGFAGCDGYANALIEDDDLSTALCIPGGAQVVESISAVLGKEAAAVEKKVAVIACKGDCNASSKKMDYVGIETCAASKLLFGGAGKCTFGCEGLGDCAAVCPYGAICIENGIAHIDERICVGCGLCTKACPNGIISIATVGKRPVPHVLCSNKQKGAAVRQECSAGCIACGMCAKKCPKNAIEIVNNLAVINYDECVGCGLCVKTCPVKCIN